MDAQTEKYTPPTSKIQFTVEEEIQELNREIGLRCGFYAKQVDAGKMKKEDADYRISVMQSAVNRLKALKYLMTNLHNPY